jgi:transposase
MARALSCDLRKRVVEAINQGLSRRQAAARFGVSPSSAIRWAALSRTTGDVAPKKQGGDRRSGRIEDQADVILEQVARTPDITLGELRATLGERTTSLWRFFQRRRMTLKKRRRMRPNRSAAT